MELGFKSKIETCNEHKDDCQLPLLYTKRKDDWTFIKESSWVKEETLEMRSFCCMYGKSVKVSRVQQIYKQRPGSLPLYCRKPKATVTLQAKEITPLRQWLDSVTKRNAGKRVERAEDKASRESSTIKPSESLSEVSLESSAVVVGNWVTKDGVEFLVKGTQEPDSAGMWTPRENADSTLV